MQAGGTCTLSGTTRGPPDHAEVVQAVPCSQPFVVAEAVRAQ